MHIDEWARSQQQYNHVKLSPVLRGYSDAPSVRDLMEQNQTGW